VPRTGSCLGEPGGSTELQRRGLENLGFSFWPSAKVPGEWQNEVVTVDQGFLVNLQMSQLYRQEAIY